MCFSLCWNKTKKLNNTTLSEQFQKNRKKSQNLSIPLTHIYMTAHFPGLIQALQLKGSRINLYNRNKMIMKFEFLYIISRTFDLSCDVEGFVTFLFKRDF